MKKYLYELFFVCILAIMFPRDVLAVAPQEDFTHLEPVMVSTTHGLHFKIYYIHRQIDQKTIQPLTDGSLLNVGDLYGVVFIPEQKSYVSIFESDSTDNLVRLFPESDSEGLVQKGKTYYIPSKSHLLKTVQEKNIENMYFLASMEHDQELNEQYRILLSEQKKRNKLGIQDAQDELRRSLENKSLSRLTPVIKTNWVDEDKFHSPMIASQIAIVLGMPLSKKLSTKGIGFKDGKIDAEQLEDLPTGTLLNVFQGRTATILPESYPLLKEYGKALQQELADVVLVIAAHTDNQGSPEENEELSQRRTKVIQQFFSEQFQIDEDHLLLYSYSDSKPMVSNLTAEGRRLNNRVELIRVQ